MAHLSLEFDDTILRSIRDPVMIIDVDFKVLWVNRAAAAIHGKKVKDILGRICYEACWGADTPCLDCPLMMVKETGKSKIIETQRKYKQFLSDTLTKAIQETKPEDITELDDRVYVKLTNREIEVLRLMANGYTNTEISENLSISPNTVKSHVVHIFNKLGVNDRTQASVLASRHKLI